MKNDNSYLRSLFLISISSTILIAIFFNIEGVLAGIGLRENLDAYVQGDYTTSFEGALFQVLPIALFVILIFRFKKYFVIKILNFKDEKLKFLFQLTLFSFTFIPSSFFTQIIFFRYSLSLCFVWILLILSSTKYDSYYFKRMRLNTILFVGLLLFILYIYLLPLIVLDSDDSLQKAKLILDSI
jgi:hypothetical protein